MIKKFIQHKEFVLGDRAKVTMLAPFMQAYVELLIETCHKRGVHAMGGMAAQIPIKDNKEANDAAFEKVRQDKLREVKAGHDGTALSLLLSILYSLVSHQRECMRFLFC